MPERKVLRDTRNATIMNALRSDLPLSYQQRIPEATQGSVKQTAELLFSSGNRAYLNEFVDVPRPVADANLRSAGRGPKGPPSHRPPADPRARR